MLHNYLKVTLRHLRKAPGYAALNILGLAIGLASCLVILLYVQDELSYDRYHEHADNIYRVGLEGRIGGEYINVALSAAPMARTLVAEFPEVAAAVRFINFGRRLVAHEDRRFYEDNFLWADSTLFDVFSWPLLQGDPADALARPNTVLLTASTARKYFADANPIGRTLRYDNERDLEVTGIVADVPPNSHFTFDALGSLAGNDRAASEVWISNNYYTYFRVHEGATGDEVAARFPGLIEKYVAPQIEQALGRSFEEAVQAGLDYHFVIQPLTDIYLHSDLGYDLGPTSDVSYVYVLSAIALFILLIACINFMNLATARSAGRAREVGLRKVLGSARRQLMQQFLGESVVISLAAALLALGLVAATMPFFRDATGKALALTPGLAAGLVLLAVLVGLLSGLYPAVFLSAFEPAAVLKGSLSTGVRSGRLRSTLVVTQFAISIALLVGTGVVFDQLGYMQQKRLGFTQEQVVVLPIESQTTQAQHDAIRQELLAYPHIVQAAATSFVPGRDVGDTVFRPESAPAEEVYNFSIARVTPELLPTMEMSLAAGRNFSPDRPADATGGVLINETAARQMGWTPVEAVGRSLAHVAGGPNDEDLFVTVLGVVEDFHFASLHDRIRGLVLHAGSASWPGLNYMVVRIRPDDVTGTLSFLEQRWKVFEPGYPFQSFFLDADFGRLYASEQRLSRLFGYFTALALFVACLGLFGLASFVTQQRTKEIGIRKVMGASVGQVVVLLSREFTLLVLLAFVVAVPVAYFMMDRWLQDFAYRTAISPTTFVLAGLAALGIAWLTVGYQTLRAAITDPVKALRYE